MVSGSTVGSGGIRLARRWQRAPRAGAAGRVSRRTLQAAILASPASNPGLRLPPERLMNAGRGIAGPGNDTPTTAEWHRSSCAPGDASLMPFLISLKPSSSFSTAGAAVARTGCERRTRRTDAVRGVAANALRLAQVCMSVNNMSEGWTERWGPGGGRHARVTGPDPDAHPGFGQLASLTAGFPACQTPTSCAL